MSDKIKLASAIGFVFLLAVMCWYFQAQGITSNFVTGLQALFFSMATGLFGGFGTVAVRRGYKALKRGR